MPSGKSSKATRSARSAMAVKKPKPWGAVAAVLVLLIFAGGVFGYVYLQATEDQRRTEALAPFTPSAQNQDPSKQIPGMQTEVYPAQRHVRSDQRVAYDKSPPFGGPHDEVWAACDGVVYDRPVRTENMVHALEHGAVWIAYRPDLPEDARQALIERVRGQGFLLISPYPGLDRPISLQAWGHQLKVDNTDDPRIDQFIHSLRRNQYTYPETGATCEVLPGEFDPRNPPPFVAKPPGPDAVRMDQGAPAPDGSLPPMGGGRPPGS